MTQPSSRLNPHRSLVALDGEGSTSTGVASLRGRNGESLHVRVVQSRVRGWSGGGWAPAGTRGVGDGSDDEREGGEDGDGGESDPQREGRAPAARRSTALAAAPRGGGGGAED